MAEYLEQVFDLLANDESELYADAAQRLERSLDIQIDIIDGIDTKAEHVTRLIALLIGLIFSFLSIATRFDSGFSQPNLPTLLAFLLGISLLLASMGFAIITYLSSRFRIGLHENVGHLLSNAAYESDLDEHLRRVVGTYAFNIEENRQVIEVNSQRFRYTLVFLLCGVIFVSLSGILYLFQFGSLTAAAVLVIAVIVGAGLAWYIIGQHYLTLPPEPGED